MPCLKASLISQPFLPRPFPFSLAGDACAAPSALIAHNMASACEGLLPARQAFTLQTRQAGVLRIEQGRVWITFSHADLSLGAMTDDHFCSAGEGVPLVAGAVVVMETWGATEGALTRFSWHAAATGGTVTGLVLAGSRLKVLQPLQDVRLALGLAAEASVRLVQGLVHRSVVRLAGILQ